MFHGTVSFCPEDNKLRLYVGRVPRDEYERLRDAGFVSTPKQDCDFVAVWTPAREDIAREYLDDDEDIGDEDYSPEERAADKSERFEGYRDKRATEAGASADAFDAGPSAFGHQNRRRAERQALRHDRKRVYAVSQWSKAEYWHERTASVIAHALHKSSAHVRRGRILTLEAEQRKHLASIAESQARYDGWAKVATMEGADELLPINEDGYVDPSQFPADGDAMRLAYVLANHNGCSSHFDHPTCPDVNAKSREIHKTYGHGFSPYDLLTKTEYIGLPFERLTPKAVAELYVAKIKNPSDPETSWQRWARHYELRLGYEKAMLENEGGMAGEAEMEVGGWIRPSRRDVTFGRAHINGDGWCQIRRVFKSPATGRVTSVQVMGADPYLNDREVKPRTINVERLGENCYRAPTDEERAAFTAQVAEAKAEKKANSPKGPSLVNPTNDDAERLQALWNAKAAEVHDKAKREGRVYGQFTPTAVRYVTQAAYSAHSKGSYSKYETIEVCENGQRPRRWDGNREATNPPIAFKVRKCWGSGNFSHQPDAVVVITDKPQKPLPIDWDLAEGKPVVKKQAALFETDAEPVAELASV